MEDQSKEDTLAQLPNKRAVLSLHLFTLSNDQGENVLIKEESFISSCLFIRYVGVRKREDRRDGEAMEAKGRKISFKKQFIVSSILPKIERKNST